MTDFAKFLAMKNKVAVLLVYTLMKELVDLSNSFAFMGMKFCREF
jgi:hypothetical protein